MNESLKWLPRGETRAMMHCQLETKISCRNVVNIEVHIHVCQGALPFEDGLIEQFLSHVISSHALLVHTKGLRPSPLSCYLPQVTPWMAAMTSVRRSAGTLRGCPCKKDKHDCSIKNCKYECKPKHDHPDKCEKKC